MWPGAPEQTKKSYFENLTPEEANRIIHSHRKVRYGTACWPCRRRKVKCDNKSPCENCVKREHPQLCSYKPNRSTSATQGSSIGSDRAGHGSVARSSGSSSLRHAKKREHSPDGLDGHDARGDCGGGGGGGGDYDLQPPDGLMREYADSEPAESSRFLGRNSIPALLRAQSLPNEQRDVHDMRPILGLDNSAPFPLMSQQHLGRLISDISCELPSDREVMKLFRTYKEIPQPFWCFVPNIDELESRLMVYLEDRFKDSREKDAARATKPVSASWLAILFAVLACGSQYHDAPYRVRIQNSRKYVHISFHFLRLSNFLLRPNLDSVRALLLTCFVLLNDMNAEASWALLALAVRLAQSLGVHRPTHIDSHNFHRSRKPPSGDKEAEMATIKRQLWWTCQWHDTLTSLSFDRYPMTNILCCPIPEQDDPEGFSYLEAMYTLNQFIGQHLGPEVMANSYDEINDNCKAVERIGQRMRPSLQSKEACLSAIDRLQFFAFRLHASFIVSVCCRPALRADNDNSHSLQRHEKEELAERCKINLIETVRMFLSMHQLSVIPTRSWSFTYYGLSSAVLLGIVCDTKSDDKIHNLLGDLISALSVTAAKGSSSSLSSSSAPASSASSAAPSAAPSAFSASSASASASAPTRPRGSPKSEKDIELSGPLSRALAALKNIHAHGSVIGSTAKKEVKVKAPFTPDMRPSFYLSPSPSQSSSSFSPTYAAAASATAAAVTGPLFDPLCVSPTAAQGAYRGNRPSHQPPTEMVVEMAHQHPQPQQQQQPPLAPPPLPPPPQPSSSQPTSLPPLSIPSSLPSSSLSPPMSSHQHSGGGSSLARYQSNGLIFVPAISPHQGSNLRTPELAQIDPASYMAPLDLHKSIFWESPPDLSNSGMEVLPFEYAQDGNRQDPLVMLPPQPYYF